MNRKKPIELLLIVVAFCVLFFFYFQTPKLEPEKITRFTISALPSPPKEKTVTNKEDIQKFSDYFNSLRLYPEVAISVPAGASVWIKTTGNLYTHQITATGHIIQFDSRTYRSDYDVAAKLRQIYQSFDYPEKNKAD